MSLKKAVAGLALCLFSGFAVGGFTEAAYAQGNSGADKELASRESGTLGTKQFDKDKLPGKLEMGLAGGSILVLIAVIKWL